MTRGSCATAARSRPPCRTPGRSSPLRDDGGLEQLILGFAPATPPAADATTSPGSVAMAKELKRRGFAFVGPTTAFALMQALGLFDPHVEGCHRRSNSD